ncbi:MAG: AAA family ATPase [Patescibacteria group bacterium]|nr:ATP-dependent RecD-like DNA helicase [Patescibacteria group bacterium]
MSIKLSRDQKLALESLLDWYKDKNKNQFITLGGYAGTGKTTLISAFRKKLYQAKKKAKVAFVTYTGKASRVLDTKLKEVGGVFKGDFVGTIHSLIYSPVTNDNEEIVGWELKEDVKCDLIIIDEASMVNSEIWSDLISYKIPIIAVGDHGQLPPIEGRFNLLERPDILLEQIHRQAEGNPIIQISICARRDGRIPFGRFGDSVKKIGRDDDEVGELLEGVGEDTMVLCGYNNTRVKLNQHIRANMGFETDMPESGDRVICLRNNHVTRIYNGMLGNLDTFQKGDDEEWYLAEINFDDGGDFKGLIYLKQFNSPVPFNFTSQRRKVMKGDLFDFGYALTVHKAQGGQARRVILFEERFRQMDDEMWRRWLYTGVTRAEEELYLVGNS